MGSLDGKVAIVTGGANGIGRRTAEVFVEEGARVVIADRQVAALDAAVRAIGRDSCEGVVTDVRDEAAVESMVQRAFDRFGRLDVALNAAGVRGVGRVDELAISTWQRLIDVHLTGVFLCVKHESARLIAQGQGGSIINMSSINGIQPAEGLVAYCAAKAGIAMVTKVAALELGQHRIRVNALAPGLVHTDTTARNLTDRPGVEAGYVAATPLGRVGEPDDIARLCAFLASDASSWITGQVLSIDGGASLKKYPEINDLPPLPG